MWTTDKGGSHFCVPFLLIIGTNYDKFKKKKKKWEFIFNYFCYLIVKNNFSNFFFIFIYTKKRLLSRQFDWAIH